MSEERLEEIQLAVLEIIDNFTLLANSKRYNDKEKLEKITEYAKEQHDIIYKEICIYNDSKEDKIIELPALGKRIW